MLSFFKEVWRMKLRLLVIVTILFTSVVFTGCDRTENEPDEVEKVSDNELGAMEEYPFTDLGLWVYVPEQKSGQKVVPTIADLPSEEEMLENLEDFVPVRIVANLVFVLDDDPEIEVYEFDPPVIIKIGYTEEEKEQYGAELAMAFWASPNFEEDEPKDWIKFGIEDKHTFTLVEEPIWEYIGYGMIELIYWGDPPIAIGQ